MRLCTLNAGLLLVKLLPPVMTEPAAEIEAPLMTADHPDSPLAFGILQHTDEEPLVHALFSMHCHSLWSAAIDANLPTVIRSTQWYIIMFSSSTSCQGWYLAQD